MYYIFKNKNEGTLTKYIEKDNIVKFNKLIQIFQLTWNIVSIARESNKQIIKPEKSFWTFNHAILSSNCYYAIKNN